MKIKFCIHPRYTEPEIVICGDKQSEYLEQLRQSIADTLDTSLTGYHAHEAKRLRNNEIIRFYTDKDRVVAECTTGLYVMKQKLYELEQRLDTSQFVRVSRFEIVNIHKVIKLDTGMTGTIRICLEGNIETYVSRRNVSRIKTILGA